MAGVHGCGCWEAGAISPTKAFRSSAWAQRGPIYRPTHRISTAARIRRSKREESTSWAASGGDTTGCLWKRRGPSLHQNIRGNIFSTELKVMRRHTHQQPVSVQWIGAVAKWHKLSLFEERLWLNVSPFFRRCADSNLVTVSPYRPEQKKKKKTVWAHPLHL